MSQLPAIAMDSATALPIEHHRRFFFWDGNIILSAIGEGGKSVLFKVHKSVLSRHSEVFEDMFAVADPVAEESVVEGAEAVVMQDTVEEVESFLTPFYVPRCVTQFVLRHVLFLTFHPHQVVVLSRGRSVLGCCSSAFLGDG